jgi:hypothetical protein
MNQPAFPLAVEGNFINMGMSMRDYFASAYLANKWCACENVEDTAKKAYEVADAMLKARYE